MISSIIVLILPVNYRPISILTAINKVFERILHRQIVNYLEQNRLLPHYKPSDIGL